ncbi:hypothetical protein DPMN_163277 [Dreissena polymorpha]|uniref:Uncharacterized protein n=1 Tax=Dreissena polymorpha TaxID=45954 RepID=A0A9D4EWG7_DREPO|nr:hypothetical protein DPMN_163277 [Dreissena polymorpha]
MLQEMNFWSSMNGRQRPALEQMHQMPEKFILRCFSSPQLRNRDPIYIYKQYSDYRPPGFSTDDSPFYLATRTVPLTDSSDQISGTYGRNLVKKN